jgi:hypothetical protein
MVGLEWCVPNSPGENDEAWRPRHHVPQEESLNGAHLLCALKARRNWETTTTRNSSRRHLRQEMVNGQKPVGHLLQDSSSSITA